MKFFLSKKGEWHAARPLLDLGEAERPARPQKDAQGDQPPNGINHL